MSKSNTGYIRPSNQIIGEGGIRVSGAEVIRIGNGGPGGTGAVVQEVFGQYSTRPTQLLPAPFSTLLTVPITTTLGTKLHVQAALSGQLRPGNTSPTFVKGAIRVLVDGADPQMLGASASGPTSPDNDWSVSLSMQTEVSVLPGAHTVELQWQVLGDGDDPPPTFNIQFPDLDGATLIVREVT